MKRVLPLLPILCGLVAGILRAQSPDAYQQAYIDLLKSSAELERDAIRAGETLAARTDRAASDAVKFESARKAFFESNRATLAESVNRLQPLALPSEIQGAKAADAYISSQDAALAGSIESFANDPDAGIQRLRQSLERERAALASLRTAMGASESATGAIKLANESVERARAAADDQSKAIAASFEQSASDAGRLVDAWPAYYRALASGARGIGAADPAPAPAIQPPISSSALIPPAPAIPPAPVAPPAPATGPAPITSSRPAPSVSLSRYAGSWELLAGVSTYHGRPPITFEVVVKAEDGQVTGTVNATFVVEGRIDPAVRFTFSGPLQAGRFQSFPLQTPDGAAGKVELIPGNAFNLLEVNFNIAAASGKVSDADVILVKK